MQNIIERQFDIREAYRIIKFLRKGKEGITLPQKQLGTRFSTDCGLCMENLIRKLREEIKKREPFGSEEFNVIQGKIFYEDNRGLRTIIGNLKDYHVRSYFQAKDNGHNYYLKLKRNFVEVIDKKTRTPYYYEKKKYFTLNNNIYSRMSYELCNDKAISFEEKGTREYLGLYNGAEIWLPKIAQSHTECTSSSPDITDRIGIIETNHNKISYDLDTNDIFLRIITKAGTPKYGIKYLKDLIRYKKNIEILLSIKASEDKLFVLRTSDKAILSSFKLFFDEDINIFEPNCVEKGYDNFRPYEINRYGIKIKNAFDLVMKIIIASTSNISGRTNLCVQTVTTQEGL